MTVQSAAVFVHGLFSSPRTWDPLLKIIAGDDEISDVYDVLRFEYQSPRLNWRLTRRIPDFNTIADSFATFFEVECAQYERIVIIAHSQGGLIIQRFLARMISQSRGLELGRIRRVVLLSCPNNGSEMLLLIRKTVKFWNNPQERELRPLNDAVIEAQRRVLNNVIFAGHIASDRCPIRFAVYAGESDNVVTPSSANSVFPIVGALPGDHNSILRSDSREHRTYTTVKANLLTALGQPAPPRDGASPEGAARWQYGSPTTAAQTPVMRVTTTTTEGAVSRSQEIEIFDNAAADLWIQAHGISPRSAKEHDDVG